MRRDKVWYYFNGFNSAILDDYSANAKIAAVADHAMAAGYRFEPVSICYRRAPDQCTQIIESMDPEIREAVFSGSSMGGWFARIVQMKWLCSRTDAKAAALAFNPAFDLGLHGHLLLGPQVNFVTLEEYVWTPQHGQQLERLEHSVDYNASQPFYVYVDQGDEVISWNHSALRHSTIARFKAYAGGSHSFEHFHDALRDFRDEFCE